MSATLRPSGSFKFCQIPALHFTRLLSNSRQQELDPANSPFLIGATQICVSVV